MNQLAKGANLPVKLEDLARFVLIGREKLNAVKAGIRAIEKLDLAKEVMDQKKNEAQDLAGALLDAEVRIGQLFKALPKASGGKPFHTSITGDTSTTTKQATIANLGFDKNQAVRFETLAEHPTYQAMIDLSDRAKLPCIACRYAGDFSWFKIVALNEYAKAWIPEAKTINEREWITLLYHIRGYSPPASLFKDMNIEI